MDATTELLSTYAYELACDSLDRAAAYEAVRSLVDSVGCAFGGFHSEPGDIARRLARRATGEPGAGIIGTSWESVPELAAFANTVMVRYLDCNDVYFSNRGNGAHPSDMIPAVLAAAQVTGADGRAVLSGIVAAYEVLTWLCDTAPFTNMGGWDYGTFTVIGAACGAANVMRLDRSAFAHAISLAAVSNVALGAVRWGALSMWKGAASANATRAGLFAAQLAADGMTGPAEPFDGPAGLWDKLAGSSVDAGRYPIGGIPSGINRCSRKRFPSQSHTQGPIEVALALHPDLEATEVTAIRLWTYRTAVAYGASSARWNPTTRETADHSIPYVVATALLDGDVTPTSFEPDLLARSETRRLLSVMSVDEDPTYTDRFPNEEPCRIEVTLASGKRLEADLVHPLGHRNNPLTDQQIDDKLHRLTPDLPGDRRQAALKVLWGIEQEPDIGDLFADLDLTSSQ